MTTLFLELYEPLDIIGNGSFGIIRKVRRKSDGVILARKELNFERMSERDRKQIVAEVNILKDLKHEHIVRYHDRYVDRDAGVLYILMEYCGGGDLSTVIKQAQKHNRAIPEDTVWNYFMQILLALQYCHHPNGHGRSSSASFESDADGKERRAQILHRDLKPDNVFLSEGNMVKLGDFGLSKALAQASFANTYVGTPYYMSPELMQEKAYDSKSDIWSLGCLIYELCALKPPFHEAKTHQELSIFIRNGRIPPLPRGYSQALSGVIKAMLNLNPAMRPSAAQLLQHERLELVFKVSETEKMLATVKVHKATVVAKEREILARESAVVEREAQASAVLAQKDAEIIKLQELLAQAQRTLNEDIEQRIREAVSAREEELRAAVMRREGEVAAAIARREEEIMDAVRKREDEIYQAWLAREERIRLETEATLEEKIQWINKRTDELKDEEEKINEVREQVESKLQVLQDKDRKDKAPLEEVKNLLAPIANIRELRSPSQVKSTFKENLPIPATPVNRLAAQGRSNIPMASAMKGVVFTATGEPIATPAPSELAHLFDKSPKVGLNFAEIFSFEAEAEEDSEHDSDTESHLPSPSKPEKPRDSVAGTSTPLDVSAASSSLRPTRLRRPSIRGSLRKCGKSEAETLPSSLSDPGLPILPPQGLAIKRRQPSPSSFAPTAESINKTTSKFLPPAAQYDLNDEENLPSPFLKRIDKERAPPPGDGTKRRQSTSLRATAVVNSANRAASIVRGVNKDVGGITRPSLASARKASEEARKALARS